MNSETLTGSMFARMVAGGAANLKENKTLVNDLNVFPVPDGDTGDNMYMTIDSGASSAGKNESASLAEVARTIAKGMLFGARGNSGVILSQIFEGISEGLEGIEAATVQNLAKAMESGIEKAYSAVSKPVEGTILTVYKDAVRYANDALTDDTTFSDYFRIIHEEMSRSLDRTPDLLPVLKEAGVVDSGGAGILYIAEGMKKALNGEAPLTASSESGSAAHAVDLDLFTADSVITYGYCTEFLLRLQNAKMASLGTSAEGFDIAPMKAWLESIGDSLVILKNGSIVKVHVHTRTPGAVLNEMQKYGEFLTLKIENMNLQHEETLTEKAPEVNFRRQVRKPYATVCVAAGEGITSLFTDLGVDCVVNGGQSMNPSAADFVAAFDSICADNILVFPCNGNIVMAAKQAAELYNRANVTVLPAKTLGAAYAALSELNLDLPDTDAIVADICAHMQNVVTGMVAVATRDTETDGITVHKNDYIGFTDKEICVDDSSRSDTVLKLADCLDAGDHDVVLLLSGQGASEDECEELAALLGRKYRFTEFIPLPGGQPVYEYIMILN